MDNDNDKEAICLKCKHLRFEHTYDEETNETQCRRIMAIEAGKFYFCRCSFIDKSPTKDQNGQS